MSRRGFAFVELVVVVIVLAIVAAVLLPMASRTRNADGLHQSVHNVATLMKATLMYHAGENGRAPMRWARYSNGQVLGWDTWNFGGKNCDIFWAVGGGLYDESAYSRPLNRYLPLGRIPRPANYVSTPITFQPGTPTPAERQSLQIDVFRSPGDVATRQRNWPNPTPTVSGYDDVGTSYLLNMMWWGHPSMGSGTYSQRYTNGVLRVGLALGGSTPDYVFITDHVAPAVANGVAATGEFGGENRSMLGYADGRVRYVTLVPSALSGPGYTFLPAAR